MDALALSTAWKEASVKTSLHTLVYVCSLWFFAQSSHRKISSDWNKKRTERYERSEDELGRSVEKPRWCWYRSSSPASVYRPRGPTQPNRGFSRNFPASSAITEYAPDFLTKRLPFKDGNQTNGPGFSAFKLMQFAGS